MAGIITGNGIFSVLGQQAGRHYTAISTTASRINRLGKVLFLCGITVDLRLMGGESDMQVGSP
ncbi:MAG: hypothetical protein ABSE85_00120 [Candidatus Korobacteraceae bacterium]|jgi:hypothetical protein